MAKFATHIEIAGHKIGPGHPCLIIAEGGVNHFGDIQKAFDLIDMACEAGADIFKLQHFKTDELIGPSAPDWRQRLRSKELKDDEILLIKERCDTKGIIFMCTGHDESALNFLDEYVNVPAFKIGSGEVSNWPSLKKIAGRKKPIILSTGMYELDDIRTALNVIHAEGCYQLAVLHCVTAYPTNPRDVNLLVMEQIRSFFNGPIGYSDHTEGTAVPLAAVAMGANVIEKHITIDRNIPNAQDWKVSCDPSNFSNFISDVREVELARGGASKKLSKGEHASILWARKSLHTCCDIPTGTILTEDMIVSQRPGDGMEPYRIEEVMGKKAIERIPSGAKINPKLFT
jgi:N,N'-diacetyllegionaminate synthase